LPSSLSLREALRVRGANADLDQVAGLPALGDHSFTLEAEARPGVVVRDLIGVAFEAIVPEHNRFVDMARDLKAHLAVALAGRRRFKLGDALLEIGAAVAAQIRSLGRRRTHYEQARSGEQCQTCPRHHQSPSHASNLSMLRPPVTGPQSTWTLTTQRSLDRRITKPPAPPPWTTATKRAKGSE
jgi:hypothetical protein